MKKQIIKVRVKHNGNLQPLVCASVYWSEHFDNPDDENHTKTDKCIEHVTVTDQDGFALIG